MPARELFVLTLVLQILAVRFTAAEFDSKDESDDDEYRSLKSLLLHKPATAERSPSVIDNLIKPIGACANNPCEHAGVCIPKGEAEYECQCVGPWRGTHCSIADACYKSPCQNGGTCLNVHDEYWCKCTKDYYGINCQSKYSSSSYPESPCRTNICNAGRCVSLKTTYYCECPDGRYGDHCEKRSYKRGISSGDSYYQLMRELKRGNYRQHGKHLHKFSNDPDVAYYDPKNGIYF